VLVAVKRWFCGCSPSRFRRPRKPLASRSHEAPAACVAIGDVTFRAAKSGTRADYTVRIDQQPLRLIVRIEMTETRDTADLSSSTMAMPVAGQRSPSGIKNVKIDTPRQRPDQVVGLRFYGAADYRSSYARAGLSPRLLRRCLRRHIPRRAM